MTTPAPLDPRILAGTRAMMASRAEQLRAGAHHLGWKLGFGAPAALERLGIDRPLVGYLTRELRLDDAATVPIAGWTRPMFEAELAVHLGADLPAGASVDRLRSAVAGVSLAIELADLDQPPDDVEAILRGNIYHRHVLVGTPSTDGLRPDSVHPRVLRDDVEVDRPEDVQALTGRLEVVLPQTAETLETAGGRLSAGDVVIVGSFVPPLEVRPGQQWRVEAPGYESVSVAVA